MARTSEKMKLEKRWDVMKCCSMCRNRMFSSAGKMRCFFYNKEVEDPGRHGCKRHKPIYDALPCTRSQVLKCIHKYRELYQVYLHPLCSSYLDEAMRAELRPIKDAYHGLIPVDVIIDILRAEEHDDRERIDLLEKAAHLA